MPPVYRVRRAETSRGPDRCAPRRPRRHAASSRPPPPPLSLRGRCRRVWTGAVLRLQPSPPPPPKQAAVVAQIEAKIAARQQGTANVLLAQWASVILQTAWRRRLGVLCAHGNERGPDDLTPLAKRVTNLDFTPPRRRRATLHRRSSHTRPYTVSLMTRSRLKRLAALNSRNSYATRHQTWRRQHRQIFTPRRHTHRHHSHCQRFCASSQASARTIRRASLARAGGFTTVRTCGGAHSARCR